MISKLEFLKFKPTQDLACFTHAMLLQLTDFLPQGAMTTARLIKRKDHFEFLLQIDSRKVSFLEDGVAHDPIACIRRVGEKMRRRLVDWRVKRMDVHESSFWGFKEVISR